MLFTLSKLIEFVLLPSNVIGGLAVATHMLRAVASFRAAGFDVVPYPVDFRTRGAADLRRPLPSIAQGLELADLAADEWTGLLTYRVLGKTSDLFPKP